MLHRIRETLLVGALIIIAAQIPNIALGRDLPVLTIADYPRYGTELKPTDKLELRKLAFDVSRALKNGEVVSVTVLGHADFDAKGHDFVVKKSQERAMAAKSAIEALVIEEGNKQGIAQESLSSVQYFAIGLGTARPVFESPKNEFERASNRRVDFIVSSAPKAQESIDPFTRCTSVLKVRGPSGPVRRLGCVCEKMRQVHPRVLDTHYDYKQRHQLPGLAGLTPSDLKRAIDSIVLHLRPSIRQLERGASDNDFINGLLIQDDTIGRNINDFASQMVGDSATSIFDRIVLADIKFRMSDPNHMYSCYAGYSRRNHDQ